MSLLVIGKDFLVQQASEQAALEGVSLSDLEKRMMYFTESDSSCENPAALNEEFEAGYDTEEYETKLSELLHHAYERLKKEDREKVRNWNQSIQTLRPGDHYILVPWDDNASSEPTRRVHKQQCIKNLIRVGGCKGRCNFYPVVLAVPSAKLEDQ